MDDELLLQLNETEEFVEDGEDYTVDGEHAGSTDIDSEDIWEIISSFFREKGLVHQQIDSYNDFLLRIPRMARSLLEVVPRQDEQFEPGTQTETEPDQYRLSLEDVVIGNPSHEVSGFSRHEMHPLFPNECRLRDLTYDANAQVTLGIRVYRSREEQPYRTFLQNMELGRIPIMLKSMRCNLQNKDEDELPRLNECPHDQGGYFVISGTEKVLIAQERQAANHVYAFSRQKGALV
ncbi:putative DNA-directed RNA polymerase II subunit 2 [Trypanosoma cruzi]|uniref:DNA-directed RNA polymerase n=1 Tax=Trypanosoma cruzi TaxID=5693 RepID=A0A2V2UI19_TRYCR|nr:putative DNA-directed RNA polymerase II subunit 2 [Trypanosoma cruzi]